MLATTYLLLPEEH